MVLCLALPMMNGGAMHLTMVCCFVLAILLTVAILLGPTKSAVLAVALGYGAPRPHGVAAVARAPDPVALGALLI